MASGRGGGGGRPVEAGGTQPEELEPMIVDAVARPPGDVRDDGPQALVVDLVRPTAPGADDVVMVRWLAAHIGVLTTGQVEPLHRAQVLEHLQRPEDRRATDAKLARTGVPDELGSREVAVLVGDEGRDGPARLSQAIAGYVEGGDDRGGVSHGRQPTTSETESQRSRCDQRSRLCLGRFVIEAICVWCVTYAVTIVVGWVMATVAAWRTADR